MTKSYRDLFKSTAWFYARYRPNYPQACFDHIVRRFKLDGTGRLLDLGCGTGQLAIPLAKHFEEVVGMDPEPEMLAEAQAQADKASIINITWVEGGSDSLENLRSELGLFKLAMMGNAFHWMDREVTLEVVDKMVISDGGIVIMGTPSSPNETSTWRAAMKDVVRRWLGEARRAGSSYYVEPKERHEAVLSRSPFKKVETYCLEYQRSWDIDSIVGYLYSTSYCSTAVLGDKREGFEKDLRATLLKLEPTARFVEDAVLEAFLAWRE